MLLPKVKRDRSLEVSRYWS